MNSGRCGRLRGPRPRTCNGELGVIVSLNVGYIPFPAVTPNMLKALSSSTIKRKENVQRDIQLESKVSTNKSGKRQTAERNQGWIRAGETQKKKEEHQVEEEEKMSNAILQWRNNAPKGLLKEIQERATREINQEHPDTNKKFLGIPIRIRMDEIIACEYLNETKLSAE